MCILDGYDAWLFKLYKKKNNFLLLCCCWFIWRIEKGRDIYNAIRRNVFHSGVVMGFTVKFDCLYIAEKQFLVGSQKDLYFIFHLNIELINCLTQIKSKYSIECFHKLKEIPIHNFLYRIVSSIRCVVVGI